MKQFGIGLDFGQVLVPDLGESLMSLAEERWNLNARALERFRQRRWKHDAHHDPGSSRDIKALELDFIHDFCTTFRLKASSAELIRMTELCIRPYAGVSTLLSRLTKAGVPVAIVSNQTAFWARRIARRLQLDKYIAPERQIWSFEVGHSKSSAGFEMFLAFQDALKLPRERLMLFDDRPWNIQRAVEFGASGILVPTTNVSPVPYVTATLRAIGVI
jgi:FMN phosphatase YigB (HAD superfamily)